ncbi:COX5A subunit VA of cytochrome C oxidase [Mycena kentingensis (nom. inval.)]|nr:COX5A subunit VA of cytochrome C oxidase [Mycena kentingensis (nom. inval.)]
MRPQLLATTLRAVARPSVAATPRIAAVLPSQTRAYSAHPAETFESFTERYVNFFNEAEDIFEVQRGLNNCFAHDLVPAPSVLESAVRAARRVNDFATAVRIFNGVKVKVENKKQYQEYLEELKPLREEAWCVPERVLRPTARSCSPPPGITLEEELYPEWEK